jgi:two-component system sensor histidine kinase UhpB
MSRHAGAAKVEIAVSRLQAVPGSAADRLELSVHDDGRGFDEKIGAGGFGLLGMRERVRALGGSCSIDGSRGTRVLVRLPYPAPAGAGA